MDTGNWKMVGMDLSHWNVVKSFEQAVMNLDFVMLKVGGEEIQAGKINFDSKFEHYYEEFHKRKIPVGAYFFMGGKAKIINGEPDAICSQLADYLSSFELEMPLALDVEGKMYGTRESRTRYVKKWCKCMESYGYYVSIYGSDISTFKELLNLEDLKEFDKWVARYGKYPEYVKKFGMLQYTDCGKVQGINGNVDLDVAYINYPEVIRKNHLNRL